MMLKLAYFFNPITVVKLSIGAIIGLACTVRSLATSGDHHDFSPPSGVIILDIYNIYENSINDPLSIWIDIRLDIFVVDRRIIYRIV